MVYIFESLLHTYALVCDCHDDTSKGLSGECPFFKKHRPVTIHDETKRGGKLNV